ncbi:MAG TPA: hypothetical protein VG892_04460 [Terriglobales bacterium]|nr:hypothetical protein [Terriglobales bacterium]
MVLARLLRGTLCVETNGIQRLFAPTLLQRIYLFWVFRNFQRLPLNVLNENDRACVERACSRPGTAGDPDLIMGVVECDLPPPKKAAQSAPLFHSQSGSAKRAIR